MTATAMEADSLMECYKFDHPTCSACKMRPTSGMKRPLPKATATDIRALAVFTFAMLVFWDTTTRGLQVLVVATSFPSRLPSHYRGTSSSSSSSSYSSSNRNGWLDKDQRYWRRPADGDASSDDEGEQESSTSDDDDDEEWNRMSSIARETLLATYLSPSPPPRSSSNTKTKQSSSSSYTNSQQSASSSNGIQKHEHHLDERKKHNRSRNPYSTYDPMMNDPATSNSHEYSNFEQQESRRERSTESPSSEDTAKYSSKGTTIPKQQQQRYQLQEQQQQQQHQQQRQQQQQQQQHQQQQYQQQQYQLQQQQLPLSSSPGNYGQYPIDPQFSSAVPQQQQVYGYPPYMAYQQQAYCNQYQADQESAMPQWDPKTIPTAPSLVAAATNRGVEIQLDTPLTIFAPQESVYLEEKSLSFDSFQKIGLMLVTISLACYAGVSPHTLPLSQYNLRFYENLGFVSLATLAPILQILLVVSPRENDVNAFLNTFFTAFSFGYLLTFVSEIIATTLVRLIAFTWFEPRIFSLAPKVPIPVIPWVLRETKYRPKRITLLAAEIAASCIMCPIIEESVKLLVLQWTTDLKRNFIWTCKKYVSKAGRPKKKWVAEPILRPPNQSDVVTANQYVSQMLAASLGLKLCDAGRRILLYTKQSHPSKSFYAMCRGAFPIQELCGTMTALGLAKKHLLGVKMPRWKILFPAILIHGMANFRGKKPVCRWGSATPWSEMQLPALHILDSSSLPQLLSKGFAKLMWLIIILRVTGYCIKNYYMVNRQMVKRTTTYAGKPAAFTAELATTEMLKKK